MQDSGLALGLAGACLGRIELLIKGDGGRGSGKRENGPAMSQSRAALKLEIRGIFPRGSAVCRGY